MRLSPYCLTFSILLVAAHTFAQVEDLKERLKLKTAEREHDLEPKRPLKSGFDYVNTFVGTGGHGHTFPGPVYPFGMMQLGPDTRKEGWDGCGGYHFSDTTLYGFSHTHLSGTGVPDYSDLLVTPFVGTKKEALKHLLQEKTLPFAHADEKSEPGYYRVDLKSVNIQAELTTSIRSGMHRYRFLNAPGKKYILINLSYRDEVIQTTVQAKNNNTLTGSRISRGWAQHQHFYFELQTSVAWTKAEMKSDEKRGLHYALLEFPEETSELLIKVGISGTDEQGASTNLAAEIPDWNFDGIRGAAKMAWLRELSGIRVKSTDEIVLRNFYTALYHAYVHPSVWSDVDGRYRDFNNQIQLAEGTNYSVFSIWDTYRGANPLYTITQPARAVDFIESYYQQYVNTGLLPMWTLSNNETDCMIGYHSASVIADALVKHLPLRHQPELLVAMVNTSRGNVYGREPYSKQGFISADLNAESVSKTLEYAYDDWCIAQYARQTPGMKHIALEYELRSMNWRNLYHPGSGFFQPRQGGIFLPNFKPNEVNHHYTEANAWQYSLAAPHDIQRLIELKGGPTDMETFLDSLFHGSSVLSGREQADITGLIGQYAHGNEPSHHMAYLYNYCHAAYKSQEMLDRIMRKEYRPEPDGLAGNEDCGQMSAWYVLSSMGFYPVAPGSPTYALGRPMMDLVEIPARKGYFRIEAVNNSPENKYIQTIHWKGQPYAKLYITHDMIVEGGDLQIVMGDKPRTAVNDYEVDLPMREVQELGNLTSEQASFLVSVPHFVSGSEVFSDSVNVSIEKLPNEYGRIVYSTNGIPDEASTEFTHNLTFYETTTLSARIYQKIDGREVGGPVVQFTFRKTENGLSVKLNPEPANQYAGVNKNALVDGLYGGADYRSIGWQGFEGSDVQAVIELPESRMISQVSVHALQDTKSWIFFPSGMQAEYSLDGVTWKKLGKVRNTQVSDKTEGSVLKDLALVFSPVEARYIRVTIFNYGLCPSWHPGAGGKTWLFLDEVEVR